MSRHAIDHESVGAARRCVRPAHGGGPADSANPGEMVPVGPLSHTSPTIGDAHAKVRAGTRSCRLRIFAIRAVRSARSDSGLSLMELVVGLTIMTIFMTIFTGATIMMYNASSKAQAMGDTASQLSIAFNRLDKSVRYAAAIAPPGKSGGTWYVEWQTTYTGTPVCTQLRLNTAAAQLQQRTWSLDTNGDPAELSGWQPLASGLTLTDPSTGQPVRPFTFTASSAALPYEQLSFHLIAAATARTGVTTSVSDVTFTAFNSRLTTSTRGICEEAGRP